MQQNSTVASHPPGSAARWVEDVARRYSHGHRRPLGGYLGVMATYATLVAGGALVGRAAGVRLPERIPLVDLVVTAAATQNLARLVTKDAVTSPLRTPFAQYKEPGLPSEVNEEVHARGWRQAVGELLTCPFCTAQWVATAFIGGYVVAPRATRVVAATFAVVGTADLLQYAHAALAHAAEGEPARRVKP
jgi:hypothetical protein